MEYVGQSTKQINKQQEKHKKLLERHNDLFGIKVCNQLKQYILFNSLIY